MLPAVAGVHAGSAAARLRDAARSAISHTLVVLTIIARRAFRTRPRAAGLKPVPATA
jgi:hypothetical protein